MQSAIDELLRRRQQALSGGSLAQQKKRHQAGRLTARERIDLLLDEGSFEEFDLFKTHRCHHFGMEQRHWPGDGVITGYGTIDGRLVYLFAQDCSVAGGSLSETHAEKICKIMDMALKNGAPVIGLNDSGGARIQEGIESLAGYAEIFQRNVLCSGVVPQISLIFGPCAGGAVYSPALTDFILMVRGQSSMFLTGPKVVQAVTGEQVDSEQLGGSSVHCRRSGVAHLEATNEQQALELTRQLLSYLPQNNLASAPPLPADDPADRVVAELNNYLPATSQQPYDMKPIVQALVDQGSFFEIQPDYAPNLIVGFARFGGTAVGLVANQPAQLAGVLDNDAALKGARFVRCCDAFNLPLVTLVDVPGFMPGTVQEHGGIIRNGAKLLFAYAEATVPKVTLTLRKAYGGAYCVMSSKHLRGDINYAWPTAEIAVMGARGAVELIYGRQLAGDSAALTEREQEYNATFATPYAAAERGYIDAVILPENSRLRLCKALNMLADKHDSNPPRKHSNMPL
ncbi:acyl-CoA carboxylase subunit beta [Desulfuromonas thiophila]|uniref:acyl-CoA carboxylase subunit beta n=1 Tax=Desulfuromonas thiophila TaxID=57664 RepID=UPI0024A9907C|nr:acyl-CoA carboxylase subunit beta [Desulfuromonas thiophila]